MPEIHYLEGDATDPVGSGPRILAHICNDYGGWGRGFVLALSARDKRPEEMYRRCVHQTVTPLGETYMSLFDPSGYGHADVDIFVANMVAQHGNKSIENPVAVSYKALWECLGNVGEEAADMGASVHMPRIGTGLGGGDWTKIENLVRRALVELHGRDVFVYDLPEAA